MSQCSGGQEITAGAAAVLRHTVIQDTNSLTTNFTLLHHRLSPNYFLHLSHLQKAGDLNVSQVCAVRLITEPLPESLHFVRVGVFGIKSYDNDGKKAKHANHMFITEVLHAPNGSAPLKW